MAMKRFLYFLAILAVGISATAQPQRVLKGAVIDKKETPLSGAKVSTLNGSHVATVNNDGTFSIEVPIWTDALIAQYSGMMDKKLKVDGSDMIFRMTPKQKASWFLSGNISFPSIDMGIAGGIMAGYLGKWGGYAKATLGAVTSGRGDILYQNYTAGVTKRIINPLHAFVGFGIDSYANKWWCPEFGLIGKIGKHFIIDAGYQINANAIFVGAGYAF